MSKRKSTRGGSTCKRQKSITGNDKPGMFGYSDKNVVQGKCPNKYNQSIFGKSRCPENGYRGESGGQFQYRSRNNGNVHHPETSGQGTPVKINPVQGTAWQGVAGQGTPGRETPVQRTFAVGTPGRVTSGQGSVAEVICTRRALHYLHSNGGASCKRDSPHATEPTTTTSTNCPQHDVTDDCLSLEDDTKQYPYNADACFTRKQEYLHDSGNTHASTTPNNKQVHLENYTNNVDKDDKQATYGSIIIQENVAMWNLPADFGLNARHTYPPSKRTAPAETASRSAAAWSMPAISTDDLEMDTVFAKRIEDTILSQPPGCVPDGFADTGSGKPKRNKLLGVFWKSPKTKSHKIYIDHPKKTESSKGDTFGATLYTIYEPSDPYHQHFLVKVVKDGPAATMKLMEEDELVLVRNHFVPDLTHEQVLGLFRTAPVDGRKRFELIIRRKPDKKKKSDWVWMESSAVLDPEKQDHPEQLDVQFLAQNEKVKIYERRFKVQGTQFFIDMDDREVRARLLTGGDADTSKNLYKHARYCQQDGKLISIVALQSHDKRSYISVEMATNRIIPNPAESWFSYVRKGSNISFKEVTEGLYIACEVRDDTGEPKPLVARKEEYQFEQHGIPGVHFDEPDCHQLSSSKTSSEHSDAGYGTSSRNSIEESVVDSGGAAGGCGQEMKDEIVDIGVNIASGRRVLSARRMVTRSMSATSAMGCLCLV